ncbi:MAG TPA: hypothetical protein VJ417_02900, partial [Candidatus Glassbacteria bacterium]|nr:hypothetical protein [Candidatus Glassbacteria bacterium]
AQGLEYRLYSELSQAGQKGLPPAQVPAAARVVIVDTLGALAAVYRAAHAAYVGGSFGKGVHNTMEPACFGLPVVFGPRYLNSYEARLMIGAGGAFPVKDSGQVEKIIGRLVEDEAFCRESGEKARQVVNANLGATARTLEALLGRYPGLVQNGAGEKR